MKKIINSNEGGLNISTYITKLFYQMSNLVRVMLL